MHPFITGLTLANRHPVKTPNLKTLATVGLALLAVAPGQAGEKIRVSIGTQDTTINCAAGGPVVRELHLLEKYLPHDGVFVFVAASLHAGLARDHPVSKCARTGSAILPQAFLNPHSLT